MNMKGSLNFVSKCMYYTIFKYVYVYVLVAAPESNVLYVTQYRDSDSKLSTLLSLKSNN